MPVITYSHSHGCRIYVKLNLVEPSCQKSWALLAWFCGMRFCYCLETLMWPWSSAQISCCEQKLPWRHRILFQKNVAANTQHFAGQQNWPKVDENLRWPWEFNLPSQAKSTTNSTIDRLQLTISQHVGLKSQSAFLQSLHTVTTLPRLCKRFQSLQGSKQHTAHLWECGNNWSLRILEAFKESWFSLKIFDFWHWQFPHLTWMKDVAGQQQLSC